MQELQLFAWQAAARGNDVHLNANPTQGELLHYDFRQKKDELKDKMKGSILEKYGGVEYLDSAAKELRQGQTENYVEYSRAGQVVKGLEKAKAKSKYPEDGSSAYIYKCGLTPNITILVYVNNHTAVWGSWYDVSSGSWGFACCHSTVHLSYCAGDAGKDAIHTSSAQHLLASSSSQLQKSTDSEERHERVEQNYSKKRVGEGDVNLDKERLAQAIQEEKKRKERGGEEGERFAKKQKSGLEIGSHDVTEEQLGVYNFCLFFIYLEGSLGVVEAYRMTRRMHEDPMANYVDPKD